MEMLESRRRGEEILIQGEDEMVEREEKKGREGMDGGREERDWMEGEIQTLGGLRDGVEKKQEMRVCEREMGRRER